MVYLFLVIGLVLLLGGANYLVDSSVAIAQKARISNFVIGITVVGMGTSAPELFVSLTSAVTGHGDMAIGNVIGSNICNTLLILGVTALITPFAITRNNLLRDIPFGIFVSFLIFLLCCDNIFPHITENEVGRLDGVFLMLIFLSYIGYTLWKSQKEGKAQKESEEVVESQFTGKPTWLMWCIAVLSLGGLLYGGNLFLDSAVELAKMWGMSDKVISITIVAVGTSLPELITCIIAATKGNPQLALGNVLGSNIFNILLILGMSSVITPIVLQGISIVDFAVLITATVLTFVFAFTFRKRILDRIEGAILIAIYVAYIAYLLFS